MPPIAYRLSRRIEIVAHGKKWPILFTHDVLLDIREHAGLDAMAGQVNIVRPSGKLLRTALWSLLSHAGASYSQDQIGDLLSLGNMPAIRNALIEAWDASMPDPQKRQRSGDSSGKTLSSMEAWAIAGELGISEKDWLAMTPRMLQARSLQRLETMRWHEMMMGTIAASVANFGFRAPKRPLGAKDYLLHPWSEEEEDSSSMGAEAMCRAYGIPIDVLHSQKPTTGSRLFKSRLVN